MPSRGNMYLIAGAPEIDISASQVEDLVGEIKENLRLSSSPRKSKHTYDRKSSRDSPYKLPNRCENQCKGLGCLDCMRKRRYLSKCGFQEDMNPHDMLQQLLRDGNLIQEAVRRVQLGLTPKQRYFYDSEPDDEIRSPVKRYLDSTTRPEDELRSSVKRYHDSTSVKEGTWC